MEQKIRVLCVDDSSLIRSLMTEIINGQRDMEVVATAPDPLVARELIKQLNPDVLTLDVEMPRMDGLDFLEKLMRLRPMPVVMISSLTLRNSEVTLRALELGAVDFVSKPALGIREGMLEYADLIGDKIRAAARARLFPARRPAVPGTELKPGTTVPPSTSTLSFRGTEKLIGIGASTGGTEAIREVLVELPSDCPGVLITQHMPPGFTRSFAARLDGLCRIRVKEAENGERILPGHAYVAPGAWHMRMARNGANYEIRLDQEAPINRHRPSVDALFHSMAECAGRNTAAALLTGMGKDGAEGLLRLREAGATTFAQDEQSCVVYGMPREAALIGAACEVVRLDQMAGHLLAALTEHGVRAVRI